MPNLHGAARQLSRLRHVWNINGRSRERERGKKRRLIEYGRFSLVDKADNQLVKMLMHSPVVMPASRPRVFTSFRSVPTGQKLSAGSNRLIYLFWMDVSFFIKKKGTPSIRVSSCTLSESNTSWRLAATRATPETRWTIPGTAPTWVPSPRTIGKEKKKQLSPRLLLLLLVRIGRKTKERDNSEM